jgi:hypothetical protein
MQVPVVPPSGTLHTPDQQSVAWVPTVHEVLHTMPPLAHLYAPHGDGEPAPQLPAPSHAPAEVAVLVMVPESSMQDAVPQDVPEG